MPMFGVPSLNVTVRAQSNKYIGNVQYMNGFLTLKPSKKGSKIVSMSSVSNNGIVMLEEGELFAEQREMVLKTVFRTSVPAVNRLMPKSVKRTFSLWGAYLRMTVEEELSDNRRNFYTLYYWDKTYYVSAEAVAAQQKRLRL